MDEKFLIGIIIVFCVVVIIAILAWRSKKVELENWNKKSTKKFKNHRDLKAHLHLREMSRILEQNKIIEKERKEEEAKEKKEEEQERLEEEQERLEKEQQKEERITASESSSSDLGARLKKLRQMYKDGILSKVEFEKAKNKLLK